MLFSWAPQSLWTVTAALKLRHLFLGSKAISNLDSKLKSRDITLPTKVHQAKAIFFFGTHVWMWEMDYKESWALKNWCFWTVMLEKTLESLLDRKEIKPVFLKRSQPWILTGRTDAEAEAPILWPHDAKSWLIGKDPEAGKDWGQKEKWVAEDEMVRSSIQADGWISITGSMNMNLGKLQEMVEDRGPWCAAVHGVSKSWKWLSDWTATTTKCVHVNPNLLNYPLTHTFPLC